MSNQINPRDPSRRSDRKRQADIKIIQKKRARPREERSEIPRRYKANDNDETEDHDGRHRPLRKVVERIPNNNHDEKDNAPSENSKRKG
ncbi:hypothetical protein CEXT_593901 [Caerostris extrusa]|uniref:Uncharacterized protein n=1 Tax=Caerostris extrusa TaxID=172846 RepID=A0AAV4WCJ3_CAEEX|nr:hypothetical protein CEXT_593901 [Caerostris extrusa]